MTSMFLLKINQLGETADTKGTGRHNRGNILQGNKNTLNPFREDYYFQMVPDKYCFHGMYYY